MTKSEFNALVNKDIEHMMTPKPIVLVKNEPHDGIGGDYGFEHNGMLITNFLMSECGRFSVSPSYYGFEPMSTGGGCMSHYIDCVFDGKPAMLLITDDLSLVDDDTEIASCTVFDVNMDGYFANWEITR